MSFFGARKSAAAAAAAEAGARPLHLLSYDESTKKFELGEEALNALREIRGPVGVLSVCGRARQGKSFILNQLAGAAANNNGGFKVGPTVRPCTKGLWIWSAPIPRKTPAGEPYHLILLDTEGIDAYDQTGQYSTQIFSMAVLLSSLFCYNQMGGIDEAALDRLSLVTEMTKHIRVRSSGGGATDASELARFSPSFVWLLRDFYLDLDDAELGGAITPAQYLESALRNVPGGGPSVEAKNSIRDSIRGLFPERECFPLVRPVNDEKALRSLDTVPKSQLRPEFQKGLDDLIKLLFTRCRPKMVGADVLNGPALAGMAQQYVAAINGGAVPAIATAWQSVAEAECRRAAEAGESAYDAAFHPAADEAAADETTLLALHNKAMEAARAAFARAAIGGPELRQGASARLEAVLAKRFHEYGSKRRAEAAAKCAELLSAASQRVHAAANADDATVDGVVGVVEAEMEKYLAKAEGSVRHERLAGFLKDTMRFAVGSLAQRSAQALRSEAERERQRADTATAAATVEKESRREVEGRLKEAEGARRETENRLRETGSQLRAAETAAASSAAAHREEKARAAAQAAAAEAAAATAARERTATEEGAAHREKILREALETEKGRAERLADENRRAERELSSTRQDATSLRVTAQSEHTALENELRKARERSSEAERKREAAESAANDAKSRAAAAEAEARAVAARQVAAAEARAAAAEARAVAAETKVEEMKRLARTPHGGAEATLDHWKAEAEAAVASSPSKTATAVAAAAVPESPPKRRRQKSPEPPPAEPDEEFEDAKENVDEDGGNDARAAAEAMTMQQLKHQLQVKGLAHLYVGKRGVKKADLVQMFVDN